MEADDAQSKAEEYKGKVKALEQENLSKEQEITSLSHKNQLLETEVEKLDASVKHWKDLAEDNGKHSTQNETLQRRLQLLEEEAEEADKNLRETNDKYAPTSTATLLCLIVFTKLIFTSFLDSAKRTSKPTSISVRFKLLRELAINGKPSTRRCLRSMPTCRNRWRSLSRILATSSPSSSDDSVRVFGTLYERFFSVQAEATSKGSDEQRGYII